jgi:hypothetical protein
MSISETLVNHLMTIQSTKNESVITAYVKYCIDNATNKPDQKFMAIERHHILPVSLFPEYKKSDWNLVYLSSYDHLKAHYYLHMAIGHRSLTLAFNQMRRAKSTITNEEQLDEIAKLYHAARPAISKAISEANIGQIVTNDHRAKISAVTKNTVVVRDTFGNTYRTSTNDPDYISGDVVYYRTGTFHTTETRLRMSIAADPSIKGDMYYDENGDQKYFINGAAPTNYTIGAGPTTGEYTRKNMTGRVFAHNKETRQQIRIFRGAPLPAGFIYGRINFGKTGNFYANNKILFHIITREKKIFSIVDLEVFPYVNSQQKHIYVRDNLFTFKQPKNKSTYDYRISTIDEEDIAINIFKTHSYVIAFAA